MVTKHATRVLPPGTYYLGDPAYILSEHDLSLLLAAVQEGYNAYGIGLGTVRGHLVAVARASEGPGDYAAEGTGLRQVINSKSGRFALVPRALWSPDKSRDAGPLLHSDSGFQAKLSAQELRITGPLDCRGQAVSPLVVRYEGPALL